MPISWGHFSDLHFNFKEFDTNRLRKSLIEYLKENNITFDYIFITGDIFDKGTCDSGTIPFIKDIAAITKCNLKNVIICPGNHDAKRDSTRARILNSKINANNQVAKFADEKDYDNAVTNYFDDFKQQCKKITGKPLPSDQHYVLNLNSKINAYVLNTAIFAGQTYPEENPTKKKLRREDTNLYICDDKLEDIEKLKGKKKCSDNALNIVIAHHGTECFEQEERSRFINFLDTLNVDIYLCGHVHKIALQTIPETNNIHQISCGGLFTDSYNEPSFIIGRVDGTKEVNLENYSYTKGNDSWALSNTAPKPYINGKRTLKFDRFSEKPDTKSGFSRVIKKRIIIGVSLIIISLVVITGIIFQKDEKNINQETTLTELTSEKENIPDNKQGTEAVASSVILSDASITTANREKEAVASSVILSDASITTSISAEPNDLINPEIYDTAEKPVTATLIIENTTTDTISVNVGKNVLIETHPDFQKVLTYDSYIESESKEQYIADINGESVSYTLYIKNGSSGKEIKRIDVKLNAGEEHYIIVP